MKGREMVELFGLLFVLFGFLKDNPDFAAWLQGLAVWLGFGPG